MKKDKTKKDTPKKVKPLAFYMISGGLIALAAVTVIWLIGWSVYSFFIYKPDVEDSPEEIPFDTSGLIVETNEPDSTDTDEPDKPPVDPPKKTESYNFLLIGRDAVALNTDVIMLLNFNVTDKKLSIMQIPRDTYIVVDNNEYKINALFAHYYTEGENKGEKDLEAYGLSQFASLLEKNLCLKIHYYAMVNLEGFRNIVDILGGVEVDIPADMYYEDPYQNLTINLKAGKQLLDGKKAEGFVRFRAAYVQADIGRMDAQKIFMSALLKEVKDHFNINTIVKIANQVFENVKTDVSLNDMIYFAKNLLSIDLNAMSFMSMTGYSPMPPEGCVWYYVMNRQGVRDLINEYFNIYDFEITDSIFDKNRIFTSTDSAFYLNPYYIASPEDCIGGKVDSAGDINEGSIHIPRY